MGTLSVARTRGTRRAAPVLVAVVALLAALVAAPVALAADITFGESTADATFGESIDFAVDVTSAQPLARMELRIGFPDALGPYIVDVPVPATGGQHTVRYELDLSGGGHIVPNTPLSYTWAAFPEIGAEPVLSGARAHPLPRHEPGLEDPRGRPDQGPLVRRAASRSPARRSTSASRRSATRPRCSASPRPSRSTSSSTPTRRRSGPRSGRGPGRTSAARRTPTSGPCSRSSRPTAIDDPWVGIVVPHELTHLVFDTAVENPYRFPPRWLNEGLAVYLSEGYGSGDQNRVADAVETRDLIPLVALGGAVPDRPRQDVPRLRRVRVGDRLPRARARPGRDGRAGRRVQGRADRRRGVHQGAGHRPRHVPGGVARGPRRASRRSSSGPQPAPPGPLPSGWSGEAPDGVPDPIAPTSRPGATAVPGDASTEPDPEAAGASTPLLVGGLVLVVAVVIGGLVIAAAPERHRVTALGTRIRRIPSWQVTLGAALLALGFLIAAQLASEGPRIRYTSLERTPLVETALDLQAQQEALKQQVLDLRTVDPAARGGRPGRNGGHARPQRPAPEGADRRRPRRDERPGGRHPAQGLDPGRARRTGTRATTSCPARTSSRWSRSCGSRARRPSRSTASG